MNKAWALSTKKTYGIGLLIFHGFCNYWNILEQARAPVTVEVLEAFMAVLAGAYLKSAIENFLAGIKAWHLLHAVAWNIDESRMKALIKAAERLTSVTAKRKKRSPCTPSFLEVMHQQLGIADVASDPFSMLAQLPASTVLPI